MTWSGRVAAAVTLAGFALILLAGLVLVVQGRRKPCVGSPYVALGSSFAAGLGLGQRIPGSPFVCQRSANSYPQQLARLMHLDLTDMTCSGATVQQVLRGGQVFQGAQVDAIGPGTRLVTLTAGGNDVGYVGDLTALAYRRRGGVVGFLIRRFGHPPRPVEERGFERLRADMVATLREIRRLAPAARIVVVTYPRILPPEGTCRQLGIDAGQAALMATVGLRLADVTREAASEAGAILVDVAISSSGHDACSMDPWVNGSSPEHGAPFHPTLAGARAVAEQIAQLPDLRTLLSEG